MTNWASKAEMPVMDTAQDSLRAFTQGTSAAHAETGVAVGASALGAAKGCIENERVEMVWSLFERLVLSAKGTQRLLLGKLKDAVDGPLLADR